MSHKGVYGVLAPAILLALAVLAGAALAQTSASYNLEWHVVAGGGRPVGSASYLLNSTAGQTAVGFASSASYEVCSGFWCLGGVPTYSIYLPLVTRNF